MGKKVLEFFLILVVLFLWRPNRVFGFQGEFHTYNSDICSTAMASELWQCADEYIERSDYRLRKLKIFFSKYHSPLVRYAGVFLREADKNNLDWRLLPAISGVESTFGLAIPYQSFNAYGWDNGNYYFRNWSDSISYVSQALAVHYVAKGAVSIEQIAPIYNPVTPISWGNKVKYFMKTIDDTPYKLLETLKFSIDI